MLVDKQQPLLNPSVHIHKYQISPPEYLMLDLHCRGSPTSPALGQAYLIIYGVSGYHSDVLPTVYDTPYILESGSVVMETDLNMNNHAIINSPSLRSVFFINGVYNRSVDQLFVRFSGEQQVMVPVDCKMLKCHTKIINTLSTYPPITVTINNKTVTGFNGRKQYHNINLNLLDGDTFRMKIQWNALGGQGTGSSINNCLVSLLLETR